MSICQWLPLKKAACRYCMPGTSVWSIVDIEGLSGTSNWPVIDLGGMEVTGKDPAAKYTFSLFMMKGWFWVTLLTTSMR